MRKLSTFALGLLVGVGLMCEVAGVTGATAADQKDVLLATAQVEKGGAEYPLVAKKGDRYFQLFIVKGGTQLYFNNAEGDSEYAMTKDKSYPVYMYHSKEKKYVAFKAPAKTEGVTLASGSTDGEAAIKKLGESVGKDKVYRVCWDCGWGGGCYGCYYGCYNVGAYYYPPCYTNYCYTPYYTYNVAYVNPCYYGPRCTFYAWGAC